MSTPTNKKLSEDYASDDIFWIDCSDKRGRWNQQSRGFLCPQRPNRQEPFRQTNLSASNVRPEQAECRDFQRKTRSAYHNIHYSRHPYCENRKQNETETVVKISDVKDPCFRLKSNTTFVRPTSCDSCHTNLQASHHNARATLSDWISLHRISWLINETYTPSDQQSDDDDDETRVNIGQQSSHQVPYRVNENNDYIQDDNTNFQSHCYRQPSFATAITEKASYAPQSLLQKDKFKDASTASIYEPFGKSNRNVYIGEQVSKQSFRRSCNNITKQDSQKVYTPSIHHILEHAKDPLTLGSTITKRCRNKKVPNTCTQTHPRKTKRQYSYEALPKMLHNIPGSTESCKEKVEEAKTAKISNQKILRKSRKLRQIPLKKCQILPETLLKQANICPRKYRKKRLLKVCITHPKPALLISRKTKEKLETTKLIPKPLMRKAEIRRYSKPKPAVAMATVRNIFEGPKRHKIYIFGEKLLNKFLTLKQITLGTIDDEHTDDIDLESCSFTEEQINVCPRKTVSHVSLIEPYEVGLTRNFAKNSNPECINKSSTKKEQTSKLINDTPSYGTLMKSRKSMIKPVEHESGGSDSSIDYPLPPPLPPKRVYKRRSTRNKSTFSNNG